MRIWTGVSVVERKAPIRKEASVDSELAAEVEAGDQIVLGKTVKQGQPPWMEAQLPDQTIGFVRGEVVRHYRREGTRRQTVFVPAACEDQEDLVAAPTAPADPPMFERADYWPFMLGVFLIGGLIGLPLAYGRGVGLSYVDSLPWALASCVVFLVAFRQDGTVSWGRGAPVIVAFMVGMNVYNQRTGRPAFVAGGFLGFLLVIACGYVGVGIGRLVRWLTS